MQRYGYRHHYYPRQRTAYGPRRPRLHTADMVNLPARDFADVPQWSHRIERVAMPRGGERLYVHCPRCERRCASLYTSDSAWPDVQCRRCAGLVYWSQYEGRRPAADSSDIPGVYPVRALTAMRHGYRGWQDALATWRERVADHSARASLALEINCLRFAQYVAYVNWQQDCYDAAKHQQQRPPAPPTLAELAKQLQKLRQQHQRRHTAKQAA